MQVEIPDDVVQSMGGPEALLRFLACTNPLTVQILAAPEGIPDLVRVDFHGPRYLCNAKLIMEKRIATYMRTKRMGRELPKALDGQRRIDADPTLAAKIVDEHARGVPTDETCENYNLSLTSYYGIIASRPGQAREMELEEMTRKSYEAVARAARNLGPER